MPVVRVLRPLEHSAAGQPGPARPGSEPLTTNGQSLLLRVDYGHCRILLKDHLNRAAQQALLKHYEGDEGVFACDVAKCCHHGSDELTAHIEVRKPGALQQRRLGGRRDLVAGVIYGLVNVRTDGRTVLCATLNEGDGSWTIKTFKARFWAARRSCSLRQVRRAKRSDRSAALLRRYLVLPTRTAPPKCMIDSGAIASYLRFVQGPRSFDPLQTQRD